MREITLIDITFNNRLSYQVLVIALSFESFASWVRLLVLSCLQGMLGSIEIVFLELWSLLLIAVRMIEY